jgi:hypothetical protein
VSAYDSSKELRYLDVRTGADMTDRDPWQSLTRYSIGALIGIIILWIIYALTGGPLTPGPRAEGDSIPAPAAKP